MRPAQSYRYPPSIRVDVIIDFVDNGIGIPPKTAIFFEKFARVGEQKTGVLVWGLLFARKLSPALGEITYLSGHRGAAFRVQVPVNFHSA